MQKFNRTSSSCRSWDLVYIIIQSMRIYIAKLLSRSFPQHPSSEPGKIKHIRESNSASHVLEPFSAVFSPVFVLDAQACLSFLATETQTRLKRTAYIHIMPKEPLILSPSRLHWCSCALTCLAILQYHDSKD